MLFIATSVLCAPGVGTHELREISGAIEEARMWYPVWVYLLAHERETPAQRRAEDIVGGERMFATSDAPADQIRRVLWEVSGKEDHGIHPTAVWLLSDTTPEKPSRKADRELLSKVNLHLHDRASIRVLEARLGKTIERDDLTEVFWEHRRRLEAQGLR